MAISTFDQWVDAKLNRSQYWSGTCTTASIIAAANINYSGWTFSMFPGPGVTPATGSGAACTRSTVGALPFTLPGGSNVLYLDSCFTIGATGIEMTVCDRYVHTSGLDGTVFGTPQSVDTVSLPARAGGGVGAIIILEPYTSTGATSRTFTVNYTNTLGASKTTTVVGTMNGQGKCLIVPLAAGDVGVLSVQSVQIETGSTGTAGNFGVTICKPLCTIAAGQGAATVPLGSVFDYGGGVVDTTACLFPLFLGGATSSFLQTNWTLIDG